MHKRDYSWEYLHTTDGIAKATQAFAQTLFTGSMEPAKDIGATLREQELQDLAMRFGDKESYPAEWCDIDSTDWTAIGQQTIERIIGNYASSRGNS